MSLGDTSDKLSQRWDGVQEPCTRHSLPSPAGVALLPLDASVHLRMTPSVQRHLNQPSSPPASVQEAAKMFLLQLATGGQGTRDAGSHGSQSTLSVSGTLFLSTSRQAEPCCPALIRLSLCLTLLFASNCCSPGNGCNGCCQQQTGKRCERGSSTLHLFHVPFLPLPAALQRQHLPSAQSTPSG